jgi:hypothetical protein
MLGKLLLVAFVGASPWGGVAIPVGMGLALGVRLPAAIAVASVGQYVGVMGVLLLVRLARRSPRLDRQISRLKSPRLDRWMSRMGILAVPVGVFLLGAYVVAATLSLLGVGWQRTLISIGVSLALIGLAFSLALSPVLNR